MSKSGLDREPLKDTEVEADEMYQNAGEKGVPHLDPEDPPRRRANKLKGQGTMENDRPPVVGISTVWRDLTARKCFCFNTFQRYLHPDGREADHGSALRTPQGAIARRLSGPAGHL